MTGTGPRAGISQSTPEKDKKTQSGPTIPGSSPPSAVPKRARTTTKPAKLRTKPKHIVKMPQIIVRKGSQTLGEAFLMTRLLGSSLIDVSQNVTELVPERVEKEKVDSVSGLSHLQMYMM